nr:methylamine dehydrogenase (amicyanin) small subunit [uncultured Methylotenera sp.]
MKENKRFDSTIEKLARTTANYTGRRSFIGKVGMLLAGSALLPLLPVDRRARLGLGEAQAASVNSMTRERGWVPQDKDPQACDYWRHCSIDGQICDCSGGSLTSCPPGSSLSPSSWVASCYNPGDGQTYLIAYRDCCGKQTATRCGCFNTHGELPVYRPEFNNDIVWCFGAENDDMTYHCTISPVVGKAS